MSDEATIARTSTTTRERITLSAQLRRAILVLATAAIVGALALPWLSASYATTLAIEIMIAGIFALGINLLLGGTGLVSLGQGMFLGLGGYGVGIGSTVLIETEGSDEKEAMDALLKLIAEKFGEGQ